MNVRPSSRVVLAAAILLALSSAAGATEKVKAVASFSVIGDMVAQVGGGRVDVVTLVGPNGDAHVFSPTPADAKALASADVFFVNGLGFEGWIERLKKSSGFKGEVVVASEGVEPLAMEEEGHRHEESGDQGEIVDPHAWQDLANGKIYVANIRDALIAADPEGKPAYKANAAKYLEVIADEEAAVKAVLGALPEARRKIITSHDAFGYFGVAYGLQIIAPQGVSTDSEASAQDVAKIIRQIKEARIPAVFIETIADPRLLDQIARETGAEIGGALYSDALSEPGGRAPTYLDMFRHNVEAITAALSS